MPELGEGSPEPQPEKRDVYTKPELPFYQQDFDGSKPELPETERMAVLSVFEHTTNRLHDQAEERGRLGDRNAFETLQDGEDTVSLSSAKGKDGRDVRVGVKERPGGFVDERYVAISWRLGEEDKATGETAYYVDYKAEGLPTVRRDDDNGQLPPGFANDWEAVASFKEANEARASAGFNAQPIGSREVQELQDYLGVPH